MVCLDCDEAESIASCVVQDTPTMSTCSASSLPPSEGIIVESQSISFCSVPTQATLLI